ncbi:riboflavin kinase [Fistulifera solaris]|uniref:riboflavin kinase n=1 Tax=Fistulifera solaris TaxID=1519565 RepID=A0A1Z5KTL7_FISSO|nr:riboflavin kinase [Fistulifera solaris]|eukprot:GAX29288.1 riboflavin kinase [Fistulifera solaris]
MKRLQVLALVCSSLTLRRQTAAFLLETKRFFHRDRVWLTSQRDDDAFIRRQKAAGANTKIQSAAEYLELQKKVFNEMSDAFASGNTLSDDLLPVYEYLTDQIARRFNTTTPVRILDVACGTGALFPFLACRFDSLDLVGVDVSPKMVQGAQQFAQKVMQDYPKTQINVVEADILMYESPDRFDGIVMNACFGNFWNSLDVLERAAQLLKPPTPQTPGGLLFITHPLGAEFVAQLHQETPETVPHCLPDQEQLIHMTRFLPLQLIDLQKSVSLTGEAQPFYCGTLERVRHCCLPQLMRFRGPVASGYGRGGKKLGFPTANLEPALFRKALETVPTGVYFGWAVIEGRNACHKAVVNVGFSPTFEGAENAEKIVEAHLLLEESIDDFYGETMRLQLHGFLRPEIKFDSFPALVAQITADAKEAKEALDLRPYSTLKSDTFLEINNPTWIGNIGGDDQASWEFQDSNEAIEELF